MHSELERGLQLASDLPHVTATTAARPLSRNVAISSVVELSPALGYCVCESQKWQSTFATVHGNYLDGLGWVGTYW